MAPTPPRRSLLQPLGVAVVAVAACALIRALLNPLLGTGAPLRPFLLAVMLSASYGGAVPGAFAAGAATVAAWLLGRTEWYVTADLVEAGLFLAEATGVIAVAVALRASRAHAQTSAGAARRAQARADAANRAKDDFIARVSHELRGPLNLLAGWAWQLQARPGDPDLAGRAADHIGRAVATQTRLINDLLDFSRGQKGKLTLDRSPTDLRVVIDAAVGAVRDAAARKSLAVAVDLPDGEIRIPADAVRVQQVLTNLLDNAVKFTPPKGRITLACRREPRSIDLSVSDTGRGFAPEDVEALFRPFEQERPEQDAQLGGLGLGLAIARQIVALHGGTLRARSEGPGRGTTFTVTLPSE